ncbi:TPA: MazG nucleotide pyrophosphohydrolase domain-containing protein [Clostridium sporogenes]
MGIKELVQKAYENASRKGFWEDWRDIKGSKKHKTVKIETGHAEDNLINNALGNRLMLITDEVAEAHEALRKRDYENFKDEVAEAHEALRKRDYENFKEELADIVIRVADLAGGLDIDLEKEIKNKMDKNKNRPYKHGKAF